MIRLIATAACLLPLLSIPPYPHRGCRWPEIFYFNLSDATDSALWLQGRLGLEDRGWGGSFHWEIPAILIFLIIFYLEVCHVTVGGH